MVQHLILRLEAPMMAFGGITVDNYGVIRDFPAVSMITGLIGNALGWRRQERARLQSLQDRLIMACRLDRESVFLQDVQNARLHQKDEGWTTYGIPEGRENSPSYKGVDAETLERGKYLLQRRYRDYHADMAVTVAFRLDPAEAAPTLKEIAEAFDRPMRPLFIGRKTCLPARPVLDPGDRRWVDADTAHLALCGAAADPSGACSLRAQWPSDEGPGGDRQIALCDQRNWLSDIHGGARLVNEGRITLAARGI